MVTMLSSLRFRKGAKLHKWNIAYNELAHLDVDSKILNITCKVRET